MHITEYSRYAELALASYSDLDNGPLTGAPQQESLRQSGFSSDQAAAFATNWRVVDQYNHSMTIIVEDPHEEPREETISNGLSVTVFEEVSTGKRYLAIRGTDDFMDVATNIISITLIGSQLFQNQYHSLRNKVQEWLDDGTLPPTFTVTGHSLGGFLATGLATEFVDHVDHAYLYNTPGLGGIGDAVLSNYAGGLFGYILDTIGIDYPYIPDPGIVSNIKADAGEGFLTGSSLIAMFGRQVNDPVWIFIEDQLSTDDPDRPSSLNHSQRVLTDALAVYDLFTKVDPQLSLEDITYILKASTNNAGLTLETAVNSLQQVLNIGGEMVSPHNRDELYDRIHAIHEAVSSESSLQDIQIQPLTDPATVLKLKAVGPQLDLGGDYDPADAIAYRYALVHMNPFVITGNADLYTNHNDSGRLDLYDPATGSGALTESYLEDGAAALAAMLVANQANREWAIFPSGGHANVDYMQVNDEGEYDLIARGITIGPHGPESDAQQKNIIFGSGDNDVLVAPEGSSRLYGGAGDDVLHGSFLTPDRLEGGSGYNTYHAGLGDVIFDVNRQAEIHFGGVEVAGTYIQQGDNIYRHESEPFTIILNSDNSATVRFGTGLHTVSFTIENFMDPAQGFDNGDFGITLTEAEEIPSSDNTIVGDGNNNGIDASVHAQSYDPDEGVYIDGVSGNNVLVGWHGNDEIHGGIGDDVILGGDGKNRLFANAGNNFVSGGTGNDFIRGGQGNDVLNGSGGADTIHGVGGNNIIGGGGGSNLLIGGDGNDVIFGGHTFQIPGLSWSMSPGGDGELAQAHSNIGEVTWGVDFIYSDDGYLNNYFLNSIALPDPESDYGDNIIFGGGGDNILVGAVGNDIIYGGSGRNLIVGGGGDNQIWSGPNNDWIVGGSGNDIIRAIGGDNRIFGGSGDDILYGGPGNDILRGEAGNDVLHGIVGDNILIGGTGNNELHGGSGNDILVGGRGGDIFDAFGNLVASVPDIHPVQGVVGNNFLVAGSGDNLLFGGAGDDILVSGPGNNQLAGGAGNNSYHYRRGDGHDLIFDSIGFNKLYLHWIDFENLDFVQENDHLIIDIVENVESADIGSIGLINWRNTSPVDLILFDDGRVLTSSAFLDPDSAGRAFYVEEDDSAITGTDGDDYFHVEAETAVLHGGAGNNIYFISDIAEQVYLSNTSSNSRIVLDYGIGVDDLDGTVEDGVLNLTAGTLQLTVDNWAEAPAGQFVLADGTVLEEADFGTFINTVPMVAFGLPDRYATEGYLFNYMVQDGSFVDPDPGDTLTYTTSLADGGDLPEWLTFDAATQTFHGMPGADDLGDLAITVTATDAHGATVSDDFVIQVESASTKTVVSTIVINQRWQGHISRVGDVNGDGLADFALSLENGWGEVPVPANNLIIYGREGGLPDILDVNEIDGDYGSWVHTEWGIHNYPINYSAVSHDFHYESMPFAYSDIGMLGDINGNGMQDFVVNGDYSLFHSDMPNPFEYQSYIIFGQSNGFGSELLTAEIDGSDGVFSTGNIRPAGDINGDGINDFLVDFPQPDDSTGQPITSTYLVYGQKDAYPASITPDTIDSLNSILINDSRTEQDGLVSIGRTQDFNGDGVNDFLVVDNHGRHYLVFDNINNIQDMPDVTQLDGENGVLFTHSSDEIRSIRLIPDVNGNGNADLLVTTITGKHTIIFVQSGYDAGLIDIEDLPADASIYFGDMFQSVAVGGDVDGDGINDIVGIKDGLAYVVFGRSDGFDGNLQLGDIAGDIGFRIAAPTAITSAAIVGDTNGDGFDDIVLTSSGWSVPSRGYIVYGRDFRNKLDYIGSDGDDIINVEGNDVIIMALGGNDQINVFNGQNINIDAGRGNNQINVYGGNNIAVETGTGDNVINLDPGSNGGIAIPDYVVNVSGGPGNNQYIVSGATSGAIIINDASGPGGRNSMYFDSSLAADSPRMGLGSMKLTFENNPIKIHLENFDPDDVLGGPRTIETFEFSDGTVLSYEELVSQGFDISGASGDDVLTGTNLTDRIVALEGNNTFQGGGGDDYLEGGTGNNTYIYHLGDGHDVIFDHGGDNRIVFGDGIDVDRLELERADDNLIINIVEDGQITIQAWYDPGGQHRVDSLEFADGQVVNTLDLLEAPNNPPILNQPLSDVNVRFGKPINVILPEDAFIDIDPGDELTLTATLADGLPLPGWLKFNPDTATISGMPKVFNLGAHDITVTATDLAGDSISDTFTLTVAHSGKGHGHTFFPGGWGKHNFWGGFGMQWEQHSFHGGRRQILPGSGSAFGAGNPFVHGQVQSLIQAMATFSPGGYGGSHFSSNMADDMSSMIAVAWETA